MSELEEKHWALPWKCDGLAAILKKSISGSRIRGDFEYVQTDTQ